MLYNGSYVNLRRNRPSNRPSAGPAARKRQLLHTPHGWWLEEAEPVTARPPLEGVHDADVVVIGGGYAGRWTAWHALEHEPAARVAVLEAALAGHGPSGRN